MKKHIVCVNEKKLLENAKLRIYECKRKTNYFQKKYIYGILYS